MMNPDIPRILGKYSGELIRHGSMMATLYKVSIEEGAAREDVAISCSVFGCMRFSSRMAWFSADKYGGH